MKKAVVLLVSIILTVSALGQSKIFNDTIYHFTFEYPNSWDESGRKGENLRAVINSPTGEYMLAVYAYFLEDGYFDIEKLAVLDRELIPELGAVKEIEISRVVPWFGEYLGWVIDGADEILDIRKEYDKNEIDLYARSFIAVDEHYAYVLVLFSPKMDFQNAKTIFDSFDKTAGWLTKYENNSSWAQRKSSIIQILFSLGVFLYFSVFVYCGRGVKKWMRRKKALDKFRQGLGSETEPDSKWRYAFNRANKKLWLFISLAIFLAAPIMAIYYTSWAIWLGIPFFFIVGFLGYSLVIKEP